MSRSLAPFSRSKEDRISLCHNALTKNRNPRSLEKTTYNNWCTRTFIVSNGISDSKICPCAKTPTGIVVFPTCFPANPQLAQWVKRQRNQYKLKVEGKHSTLTDRRQEILEAVGLCGTLRNGSAWMARWHELHEFWIKLRHSKVPTVPATISIAHSLSAG
jgi:hypothetical protein